jgi:hypothetical protein
MNVDVYESWRYDEPRRINDIGAPFVAIVGANHAVDDDNVSDLIAPVRRIDNAAVANDCLHDVAIPPQR